MDQAKRIHHVDHRSLSFASRSVDPALRALIHPTRLKRIAPMKGIRGYSALIRAYVASGLREDMEKYEASQIDTVLAQLRDQGVPEELLHKAITRAA